ncbi:hypothetical protein [Cloacibacillus porcorum]|uniref:hypothetical protein n=1 Tax=Cloacibacillus porcorum TaxID=1197717 RepID=UPI003D0371E5
MVEKQKLKRRWMLIFLSLVLAFCLYATPFSRNTSNGNKIFLGCYPIHHAFLKRGLPPAAQIDIIKLAGAVFIISLACGIGYVFQNKNFDL